MCHGLVTGIWTPHYIKQNNTYHSLYYIVWATSNTPPVIQIGSITGSICCTAKHYWAYYDLRCRRKRHRSIYWVGSSVRSTPSGTSVLFHFAFNHSSKCLRAYLLFSAVFFFTEYVFTGSSKSLSLTEKENRLVTKVTDNFARIDCRSTRRFSSSSSAMIATSLAIPTAWIRFVHALSAHAIWIQITHNTGSRDVYWIYWPSPRAHRRGQ